MLLEVSDLACSSGESGNETSKTYFYRVDNEIVILVLKLYIEAFFLVDCPLLHKLVSLRSRQF